ncbi:sugar phosphate isomerase/epimerase family protein [Salarchaeum japonicum]|uniref:sugar phosphate isomerase/epimerase family protein n=1 Tax=Salarchaeum japonicum TaxID=555573 RepID=UPI003C723192
MRSLDLGFTLGLEMSFEPTVRWATSEGFDFVELLLDGPYARQRVEPRVAEMANALDEHGVGIVVHLPFNPDPGSPFAPVREGVVTELVAGMDLAVELGATTVVFHPSSDAWRLGWDDAETKEFVHDSLDALVPAARERGLDPCLENIVSSYYDATTFPELLERYPEASMTFDTSHAHLAGMTADEMGEFLREHADRVHHLHLVDTRGDTDEHLPVGMGRLDFDPVFDALRAVEWDGTATLEIGTSDHDIIAVGKGRVEAYE